MAKGSSVAKSKGRPPLPAEVAKRYNLGIKTTKALKDLIEAGAAASGRSLAQEIEYRLWLTHDYTDLALMLDLAKGYRADLESGVVNALMRRGHPDANERSRRWHTIFSALLTWRANHPIKELGDIADEIREAS